MKLTRLELVEGSSSKFWEIWTDGATMTVRFGRIGTDGQTKPKKLGSPAAADAEAQKLLNEKLKKGYAAKGGAKPTPKAGDAARLAELVPAVFEVDQQFSKQSGIDDDQTFAEALGKPSKEADIAALEKKLGKALPPSYRAFLSLYGGWQGFAGDCNILGAKDHAKAHTKSRFREWDELFGEFEDRDLVKEGVVPFAIGDGRNLVLLEPSKKRKGEWDFVEYHLTEEEGRYPSLVALLEAKLKQTKSFLLKPAKQPSGTKLEGMLEKLTKTSSTAQGRDLVVKWKGKTMESIELRTSKNGEAVEELLKLDNGQDITTLILGGDNDFVRAVKAVTKSPWPAKLTRLSLGHQRWGEMIPGDVKIGALALEYPKLVDLDLTPGNATIGKIALPLVKTLTLRGPKPTQWAAFARAKLPSAESFALNTGANAMFATVLGAKLQMPKLKTFAIHLWRTDQVKPLLEAVAKSPWAKGLKSFQVIYGSGDQYLLKLVQDGFAERGLKVKAEKGKDTEK